MATTAKAPTLIRAHILPSAPTTNEEDGDSNTNNLGILIKRIDDPHPASIVIYHVIPSSYAATHTALRAGCEILAVNKHRVRGSAIRTMEMMEHSLAKYGKVNLLCSHGERRSGSCYVIGKMHVATAGTSISVEPQTRIAQDVFEAGGGGGGAEGKGAGDYDTIVDGLELEETSRTGRVRIVSNVGATKHSVFGGLKLNRGDNLHAIDGRVITSIADVRGALMDAASGNHVMVPILTYNVFRKLKTAVMGLSMSRALGEEVGVEWTNKENNMGRSIQDEYDVQEKLGEGAFAVVKKATHKKSGQVYAIKIINRSSLNKDMEVALKDEISILKELDHEHIYKLNDVITSINQHYLVTEYLDGGELFDRIVEKSTYNEFEARDVCNVIFGALKYMHSKGIAHRDLKPENLLLENRHDDSQIKIADFGFAKKIRADDSDRDRSLKTMCGTPGYVAPEILRKEWYGTKADMFSMGVIVFILLGGYPPFYADSQKDLLLMCRRGQFEFDREYWGKISIEVKNMIRHLLVVNPDKRLSAEDVLSHSWMTTDKNVLQAADLSKSQAALKKYNARKRFKKAINSILFVNTFTGENAVFSGANKRKNVQALTKGIDEIGVEV